jgi:hypothetical protein
MRDGSSPQPDRANGSSVNSTLVQTVNFTMHPAKIQLRIIHIASEHLTPKLVQSSLATKHKNIFLLFFIL